MHRPHSLTPICISEAHVMVTPCRLKEEFKNVLDLCFYMMKCLGIKDDLTYRAFQNGTPTNRKEKYIGSKEEEWEAIQNQMRQILVKSGIEFKGSRG